VIDKVFGDYADVVLVSDTRSKIDVVVKRTGRRGFMQGLGRDDSYACTITSLELASQPDQRAQVGDELVTSGVGSIFPPGLLIGKITKLDGDDGMFQKVEVEPSVDVSRVRAVMVLLAPPPPADPDAKTRKRSEPAFGVRAL
jgi:rod shape-determining protein MreC